MGMILYNLLKGKEKNHRTEIQWMARLDREIIK